MDPDGSDAGQAEDDSEFVGQWRLPTARRIDLSSHIRTFLDEAMQGNIAWQGDVVTSLWGRIRVIDTALSGQLAAIMHHPDFQRLEGNWRGLRSLVDRTETSDTLKIQVLDVCRLESSWDVDRVGSCGRIETKVSCRGDGELVCVLIPVVSH